MENVFNNPHLENEIRSLTKKKLPICVDFDGTIVMNRYPQIGRENQPSVEVLKKWTDAGVGVILDSMRCGEQLKAAVEWCRDHGIELYGIGKEPFQEQWTTSNKAYGVLSVDDRNLGCPLRIVEGERPMVDWKKIDELYTEQILNLSKTVKR